MKYSEFIHSQMIELSKRPNTIFIGYNLINGSRAYGTLADIPREKIIEMPCAEALMTGMATGMAIAGYLPILYFERHDFLLLAADQIINHLSKIEELSHGQFIPKIIIRAVVSHNKPFDPGPQHIGNYTELFVGKIKVGDCRKTHGIDSIYNWAINLIQESCMIIEYKKLWNEELEC